MYCIFWKSFVLDRGREKLKDARPTSATEENAFRCGCLGSSAVDCVSKRSLSSVHVVRAMRRSLALVAGRLRLARHPPAHQHQHQYSDVHRVHWRNFWSSSAFAASKPRRVVEHRRLLVPADKLFEVVINVDDYRHFLPFCSGSQVTRRLDSSTFEADLLIGFDAFSAGYSSRVNYEAPTAFDLPEVVEVSAGRRTTFEGMKGGDSGKITAKSIDSPIFTTMDSYWIISPVRPADEELERVAAEQMRRHESSEKRSPFFGHACDVEFCIEFDMGSNSLLASTVDAFLEDVSAKQIEAFDQRARSLVRVR